MATSPEKSPAVAPDEPQQLPPDQRAIAVAALTANGVKQSAICQQLGMTIDMVKADRKKVRNFLHSQELYTQKRAEVLGEIERRIAKSAITPTRIATATLRDSAYAFKVFHEAGRLERGESTSNIAHLHKLLPVDWSEMSPNTEQTTETIEPIVEDSTAEKK